MAQESHIIVLDKTIEAFRNLQFYTGDVDSDVQL